jgi:hypothetical protein
MKENAATLSEFEKALIRKSGECDDLGFKMLALKEQVTFLTNELQEAQHSRGVGNILRNLAGGSNAQPQFQPQEEEVHSTAASILYGDSAATEPNNSGGTIHSPNSEPPAAEPVRRTSITGSGETLQGVKGFFNQSFSKMKTLATQATQVTSPQQATHQQPGSSSNASTGTSTASNLTITPPRGNSDASLPAPQTPPARVDTPDVFPNESSSHSSAFEHSSVNEGSLVGDTETEEHEI